MWEISNTFQVFGFLRAICLGGIFCIIYDILRALRNNGFNTDFAVYLQDILYFVIISPITFCCLLATTNGELRAYFFVGIIVGFIIIRLFLSRVILIMLSKFIGLFLKLKNMLFEVFNRLFGCVFRFYGYVKDIFRKKLVILLKCCKKLLKKR